MIATGAPKAVIIQEPNQASDGAVITPYHANNQSSRPFQRVPTYIVIEIEDSPKSDRLVQF